MDPYLQPRHLRLLIATLILALAGTGMALADPACTAPDPSPFVVIDGCETGVENLLLDNGCSLQDEIAACAAGASNHGQFVSCVTQLANDLVHQGLLTGQEKGRITRCAAQADLPRDQDVVVTILSPEAGSTAAERTVDVSGTIDPVPAVGRVELLGFEGAVEPDGSFVIAGFPLNEGENELLVEAFDGATPIGTASVTVFYFLPSEASVSVTPEQGGSAEVTDPESPIFGAAIDIPSGAATSPLRALVVSDSEHVPNLPFGELPVGPAVSFGPEAEVFAAPIELTLPFDPADLPAGTTTADLLIRALGDGGWELVPVSGVTGDRVTASVDRLVQSPFMVVVELPLAPGQLLVDTAPANATLYFDRVDTGTRTPVILEGAPAGSHELKVYVPGFNEVFESVSISPGGDRISITLGVPQAPVPVVTLSPDLQDGMQVTNSFIDVVAEVTVNGAPVTSGLAVLSVNAEDTFETIDPDGVVRGAVTLFPGDNLLQVRANGPNGSTGVSETINIIRVSSAGVAALNSQDITVRLSWNTDTTDLDLHTFDPFGNHSWYGNLGGIPGGQLDRDDVDGFGPEVFTLPNPPVGTYRVAVDSYRIDGIPTAASLTIQVGGQTEFSGAYLFTSQDFNATNGNPAGASPAAFWDAHTFEIGELTITAIETQPASPQDDAIFTTAAGENQIMVTTDAPASVPDADIMYEIEEANESFMIDTSMLAGRNVTFTAEHEPLQGLVNPRNSRQLQYEVIAFTLDQNGARDLESDPETITQEVRSQIRQEYVDKRDFNAAFVRATPDRGVIIDAGQFMRQPGENFGFNEFSQYSDFGPGLAVVDDSRTIANAVRNAWGHSLRITSGWRNPRRNDSLQGSALNSFHQTGDAVDLNPSRNAANWPQMVPNCLNGQPITTYAQAQQALTCVARQTLNLAVYDTLFHLNHLHIERDPNGPNNR